MSGAKAIGTGTASPALRLRLLSDERLARRSAAGDRAAFGVLFERHHQPVYRYCRSILGDAEEAADALQSTMEKALAAIGRRDAAAPLRAWLFRIAHNESISQLRRRRTTAAQPLEADGAIAPDVAATAEQRERLAQLVRDLRELPERQRGALLMREVAGLSHEEIAAAFAVSVGAVKQSIHEARTALHDQARGREMTCESVCRALGEGDGRTARQRRIRAHLRACDDCRAFNAGLKARRADLAALTPLLPGPAAAAILAAITGTGAGGGGLLAGLLGGGGASGALAKSAAVGAVTITAGAGVVGLSQLPGGRDLPPAGRAGALPLDVAPGGDTKAVMPPAGAPPQSARPASAPVEDERSGSGGGDRSGSGEGSGRRERESGDDAEHGGRGPGGSGSPRERENEDRSGRDDGDDRSGPSARGDDDDDAREDGWSSGPGGGDHEPAELADETEDHSGGSGSGSSGSGGGSGSGDDPEDLPVAPAEEVSESDELDELEEPEGL
jgi:RNA polymerase sigma factor (sigma-70 family)